MFRINRVKSLQFVSEGGNQSMEWMPGHYKRQSSVGRLEPLKLDRIVLWGNCVQNPER